MVSADRIDGWKAIGSYLGRERTTVIRWANTRDLPVHRIPGGKKATVYALKGELDRWVANAPAETGELVDELGSEPIGPLDPVPVRTAPWRRVMLGGIAAALLAMAIGALWFTGRSVVPADPQAATLPINAQSARLYLQARDDWSARSPDRLARAIASLEELVRREPDFALGYSALADAFLLAREFGAMKDVEAFGRARKAAQMALTLDPDRAEAHRALGFIHYWSDRDTGRAGEAFRRAIALAPQSAQTHFWYGNILADNGEPVPAMREFDAARMIEPGSLALQVDMAWAAWSAGDTEGAQRRLEELARVHPDYGGIYDCLAEIRLAKGDYAGFVEAFARLATLRGGPALTAQARTYDRALAEGRDALLAAVMAHALHDIGEDQRPDHSWPAFVASVRGDRAQMLAMLRIGSRRKERWGNAGYRLRMEQRWRGDTEVQRLIQSNRAPPIERI